MEDVQALSNCEVFNQIRTTITNYHQKIRKLSSFNFLSGNVENIKNLAEGVVSVLVEHGLVLIEEPPEDYFPARLQTKQAPGANLDQLRGTMMYFVLNSASLNFSENSDRLALGRSNPHCVHLLYQLPEPMSPLLIVALVLNCGMEQQLMEFLACGPHWLTSKYHDCVGEVISHLVKNRFTALPLIGSTISAVTKTICYYDHVKQLIPGTDARQIGSALELIQHHILDAEQKLIHHSAAHKRYLGKAIRLLLDNVLEALRAIKVRIAQPSYFEVYTLHTPHPTFLGNVDPLIIQEGGDKLRLFASNMMDALERLLMNVSIDAYMYWHDLPSGQLLFNLQGHICNLSKQLLDLLAVEKDYLKRHSVRVPLTNFAEAAQSFEQRLAALSLGELLGFLDGEMGAVSNAQLLAGLEELQQRPIAFSNDECVEAMSKHVHLLQPIHAGVIMVHLAHFMQAKREVKEEHMLADAEQDDDAESDNYLYADLLRQVLMPIFKACTRADVKLQMLQSRDKLKLLDYYIFEQDDFKSRRIYFFNHLPSDVYRFPLMDFLDLCYEHPSDTWLALAQLAMTHKDYAKLYFHVAVQCTPHAMNHVPYMVSKLMLDECVLCQRQLSPHMDLLLKLYEQPVILNGMYYRLVVKSLAGRSVHVRKLYLNSSDDELAYTCTQLKSAQESYLQSLVAGIEKFVKLKQYAALERLLFTLMSLESVENRLNKCSRKGIRYYRHQLKVPEAKEQARKRLKLANEYAHINAKLTTWRLNYWPLVSQLIRTMDSLRAEPGTFDASRASVLDRIMVYYVKNVQMSYFLNPDLREKVRQLTSNLPHKHLWKDGHLKMLLNGNPGQATECAMLLSMASTVEAVRLIHESMRYGTDNEVMRNLATTMDAIDTPSSLKVYMIYFQIYIAVFKNVFLSHANRTDYPYLVEHLMQTPKILKPEFLRLAADIFSVLLNVSKMSVLALENTN